MSFITAAWNTPPAYLDVLSESVLSQQGGTAFEWVILDNGSGNPQTIARLQALGQHPSVRFHRVDKNLGIIGGMRYVLERARGRYVLPLDSEDYLYPDCIRIPTWHISNAGYPVALYSDEDKLLETEHQDPYLKPDWDEVLSVNSCYIAHLCEIDRKAALELGVYTGAKTEGSHYWGYLPTPVAGGAPVRARAGGHLQLAYAQCFYGR